VALAGGSVRGHGELLGPPLSPSPISVDAWIDDSGVAQGTILWVGGGAHGGGPGGPANPWIIVVPDIAFDGTTAVVSATVAHSVFPDQIGNFVSMSFTDNSGTGLPDEIDGSFIVAGQTVVNDGIETATEPRPGATAS
jgi:hypothetical protein